MVSGRQPVLQSTATSGAACFTLAISASFHILTGGVGTDAQAVRVDIKDRGAGNL